MGVIEAGIAGAPQQQGAIYTDLADRINRKLRAISGGRTGPVTNSRWPLVVDDSPVSEGGASAEAVEAYARLMASAAATRVEQEAAYTDEELAAF